MTEMNEVAERPAVKAGMPSTVQQVTPMTMLDRALERGVDAEQIKMLLEAQQQWEANEARKAFHEAMTAFRAEPLRIGKGKHVKYTTAKGTTEYDHATLAQVCDAVVPVLSKHGLSHRWETNQQDKAISVTCIITHQMGHSERTTLSAAPDESGGKNSIQAVGSTVTYLQRYTLMASTGLAASDMDDDGRSAEPVKTLSETQIADLEALLTETGRDKAKFLKWARIDSLDEIPAKNYDAVCRDIRAAAKAAERAKT